MRRVLLLVIAAVGEEVGTTVVSFISATGVAVGAAVGLSVGRLQLPHLCAYDHHSDGL
jgi:hypothetical protein